MVILLMNKLTINNTIIELKTDDTPLVESELDAIVIPANRRLLPSGTFRCYVLRKAGSKVQLECNQIINKIGALNVGSAVITSGGNLKTKYIIHAAGPSLGQGKEGKKLMICTWNALKLADKKGLKSIAFHPISVENTGFNPKICANIMLPTSKKFALENHENLKQITFYLNNSSEYKEFETILETLAD